MCTQTLKHIAGKELGESSVSAPIQPQRSTANAPDRVVTSGSDSAAVLVPERVTAVKQEGMLNKCQAADILEESWFVNPRDSILLHGTRL